MCVRFIGVVGMSDVAYYRILEYLLRSTPLVVLALAGSAAGTYCDSNTPVGHAEGMLFAACLEDEECAMLYGQGESHSLPRFRRILAGTGATTLEGEYKAMLCPVNDTRVFQHLLKFWHVQGPSCGADEVWRQGSCECLLGHDCHTEPYTNVMLLLFFVLLCILFVVHIGVSFYKTEQILRIFSTHGLRHAYEKGIYSGSS